MDYLLHFKIVTKSINGEIMGEILTVTTTEIIRINISGFTI